MQVNASNYQQFGIPTATRVDYTYVGDASADNDRIATATYYNDSGTVLGVLAFSYATTTNNVTKIERTA